MKNVYSKFTETIGNDLRNGLQRKSSKLFSNLSDNFSGTNIRSQRLESGTLNEDLFKSLEPLTKLSANHANYDHKPGAHPEFAYLSDTNGEENHYITSLFIDISRSTSLFKKYQPFTVRNITSTIQNAALFTCWHFGGYIQRFHGDGLLVYFGGRNISISESVINSINAASFFSYFVKNDLQNIFLEQGVEKIFTRIGIDVGEAEDVLWYKAGIQSCSEVTTCSLHTSLAAHMQGNASGNGIMVGDNIKNYAGLSPDYYSIKKKNDGTEDRYIFQIPEENFNYTQWDFNWEKHLKKIPGVQDILPIILDSASNSQDYKNIEYLKSQVKDYKPYYNEY